MYLFSPIYSLQFSSQNLKGCFKIIDKNGLKKLFYGFKFFVFRKFKQRQLDWHVCICNIS